MSKKFNYCIARYWEPKENKHLSVYTFCGNEVLFGSKKQANKSLLYVKRTSNNYNWFICKVKPNK
jgi:hypothetical protein